MTADPQLVAARARCVAARAKFETSLGAAKGRLSPKALASDAVDGVKARAGVIALDGVEAVRTRPATAAAVIGAIGLVLARKPLTRWIGGLGGRDDATADVDAS